jgi:hypothetical protein
MMSVCLQSWRRPQPVVSQLGILRFVVDLLSTQGHTPNNGKNVFNTQEL